MDGDVRINPYLSGNFAPIRSEDDFTLEVEGQIPSALAGALYRIGPNPQFEPRDPNHHWFAGDGMTHAFFIEDGRVRYRNRYVRTPKWADENAAGRALFGTFGNPMSTDPSVFGHDSGVANTNIVAHAGRLMALEEGHGPFAVDPHTLEPRGYVDFGGRFTAHPKFDPETGEMVFFGYSVGPMPFSRTVSYGVVGPDGALKRRDDFEAPYSSMVHDFLVTREHVLFPILPLTGDLERAMKGGPAYAWEPDKGGYVGVMRRDASVETIRWFNAAPGYVFHPMNAWEADGKIFADVMRYDEAPLFPRADGSRGRPSAARLVRWTFDLGGDSDAIQETPLDDLDGEFPRFDERRSGLSYRHGWFAGDTSGRGTIKMNALAHIDLATGRRATYALPDGDLTSEPVFVPRAADAAEGDGWLLAVVWRARENRSDLVVFEARDVERGPIATAKLPRRVPFGFHGNWVGA